MPQKQKIDYLPTLFTTNKKTANIQTGWKTLDNIPAFAINPGDINECKDFIKSHEGISGFNILGQTNYANQYIANAYPEDVIFDPSLLKIITIDIEILVSETGEFPEPRFANDEIVLISLLDKNTKKTTTFGSRPYTGNHCSGFVECRDEKDLLSKFLLHWQYETPDIITGWNTDLFDIPYIVNRMQKIIGDSYKKLSPWGIIQEKNINIRGTEEQMYNIIGISSLDYLDLYKKYTYKTRESYKLQNIAFDELGETKLDHSQGTTFREFCTGVYDVFDLEDDASDIQRMGYRRTELKNASDIDSIAEYKELDAHLRQAAWNLYCEYVEQDTNLVDKLDEKLKLIELHLTMAYTAKLNYNDALSPVKLWNNIIYNDLLKKNIVIPNAKHSQKGEQFEGAYVKTPLVGMHKWIASFDLQSLYPHIIMGSNISPETISTTRLNVTVDELLNKTPLPNTGLSVTANGWCYHKKEQGFLAELMQTMYESRSTDKKNMLQREREYELIKAEIKKRGL
jgi:DNA polymerase elongation subunit (family B)